MGLPLLFDGNTFTDAWRYGAVKRLGKSTVTVDERQMSQNQAALHTHFTTDSLNHHKLPARNDCAGCFIEDLMDDG